MVYRQNKNRSWCLQTEEQQILVSTDRITTDLGEARQQVDEVRSTDRITTSDVFSEFHNFRPSTGYQIWAFLSYLYAHFLS